MALIFDANGLSAFFDGDHKVELLARRVDRVALPVIVLGEYLYGIQHSRFRSVYEGRLNHQWRRFQVLPVTAQAARTYARIRSELRTKGRPIPENDIWIAALAREYKLPILTRDAHFQFINEIEIVSW